MINARTDRADVEALVRIIENEIERVIKDWLEDNNWEQEFLENTYCVWRIKEIAEHITCLFWMDVTDDELISAKALYDRIKAEVEKRKGVSK